jgi:hypothetical protein
MKNGNFIPAGQLTRHIFAKIAINNNIPHKEHAFRRLKMEMKIMFCGCKHEYQDEKYGSNKRVHNRVTKDEKPNCRRWRCTVCEKVRED